MNTASDVRTDKPDVPPSFMRLQSLLLSTPAIADFLTELSRLAAGLVSPDGASGVTARRDGQWLTVASSDGRAEQVDEVQYGRDQGPCLDAVTSRAVIDVADLTAEDRWPRYTAEAMERGVRCSLSIPVTMDDTTVGALNIYGFDRPRLFDDAHRQSAELLAAQASTAVTLAWRQVRRSDTAEQLEQMLGARSVIDQALGILMAQQHCSATEGFNLLRTYSQKSNRTLRDVAADLIRRATGAGSA
jgi:GAF domain-containing protein